MLTLRKNLIILFVFLLIGQLSPCIGADLNQGIKMGDELYAKYLNGDYPSLKKALDVYKKIADAFPNSYEANWKAAMACREYAEDAKKQGVPNWKKICKIYGKMGMKYAERAIKLNNKGVEGYFYYGLCVGSYSDGVSILTALREGLKGKTQRAFETAYKINKRFLDGTPIVALGRFWEVLPWFAGRDKKKALKLYEEAYKIMPEDSRYRPELLYYLGNLLVSMKKDRQRGIKLLEMAASSKDKYFSAQAEKALEKYKK